jgi:acetylornithine deacetylase
VSGERQLRAFLDARAGELVEFTRELVATPSVNPPGDERAVAALLTGRLAALGVTGVTSVGVDDRRPNVLAHVDGVAPGRTLVLNGHTDTKPPGDLSQWRTDPWDPVLADGELHGLGSGDMKAAVAAIVYAAGALAAVGLPRGRLAVVLSADEEAGSGVGARWLAEQGYLAGDAAVIGEPCGVVTEWEAIDLVSRGAALFRIRIRGTQTHSSVSDRFPVVNATVMMGRLADRMHRELKHHLTYAGHPLGGLGPTVNVGVMAQAGVYYGVYPGEATLACDVRTLPGMTRDQVVDDIRAFIARVRADEPELDAELDMELFVPATEIGGDEPIVHALASAARDVLGRELPLGAFPGATDAMHFQLGAGIPTVAAFGPGFLPRAHTPNESVRAGSIPEAAAMYALAAWRYLTSEET